MKNNILITGGAGYIGSTVARLLEKNNKIFIIDNLVSGNKKLLKKKYTFYRVNFGNKNKLKNIINKNKNHINIYGSNYKTKDGTCIRDYIHVSDIAYIHKLCIEYLEKKKSIILNCGYKKGYSVKEIISKYEKIFKIKIEKTVLPKRSGDPEKIICDNSKIKKHLNWKPKHNNLEEMIKSSYKWHKKFFLY